MADSVVWTIYTIHQTQRVSTTHPNSMRLTSDRAELVDGRSLMFSFWRQHKQSHMLRCRIYPRCGSSKVSSQMSLSNGCNTEEQVKYLRLDVGKRSSEYFVHLRIPVRVNRHNIAHRDRFERLRFLFDLKNHSK